MMDTHYTMSTAIWALCLLTISVPSVEMEAVTNWGRLFHTGFLALDSVTAELIIIARDDDTVVSVEGETGAIATVTVTQSEPAKIPIPSTFMATSATAANWKKDLKGLRIQAQTADIGVRLVTRSTNDKGSGAITVLPDIALGLEYRLGSGSTNDPAVHDQVLIVATAVTATVTLTYGDFDTLGLVVNDITASSDSDTVTLRENEILTLFCTNQCHQILVTSDQNIAVIVGKDGLQTYAEGIIEGITLTQNIPSKYAGTNFILFGKKSSDYLRQFKVQILNRVVGETGTRCKYSIFLSFDCRDNHNMGFNSEIIVEVQPASPVMMYGLFKGLGPARPASFNIPNINQYSLRQFIYLEESRKYEVIVTGTSIAGISVHVGEGITITFTGLTLCHDPEYANRITQVKSAVDESIQYITYINSVDFDVIGKDKTKQERGVVEFRAAELNKPFLVLVNEIDMGSGTGVSTVPAFGIKYVETYDATSCQTTPTQPEDGIDNDCDGRVDEELDNGLDDDGDGRIDEDVTTAEEFRIACLVENGINTVREPSTCSISVDTTVVYQCAPGYSHTGVGHLSRTCTGIMILTGLKPICEDKTEDSMTSPPNVVLTSSVVSSLT